MKIFIFLLICKGVIIGLYPQKERIERISKERRTVKPVLFVEDRGDPSFGPDSMPDPLWYDVLTRVLGEGHFGWWGPILSPTEDGPPLDTLLKYDLVIWNCYDYWFESPSALTAQDMNNLTSYISQGGKLWLIGQDVYWSVPFGWLQSTFKIEDFWPDYQGGNPAYPVKGFGEIESCSLTIHTDYQINFFFPDYVFSQNQGHVVLREYKYGGVPVCIAQPNTGELQTSFWTLDLRDPDPYFEIDSIVTKMLEGFGIGIYQKDVGVVSVLPSGYGIPGSFPLFVKVKNYGLEQASFSVSLEIDGNSIGSIDTSLPSGEILQLYFGHYDFSNEKFYYLKAYTQLSGDENPSNDTLFKFFKVKRWIRYDDELGGANAYAFYEGGNAFGIRFHLPYTSKGVYIDSIGATFWGEDWPNPGDNKAIFFIVEGDNNGLPTNILWESDTLIIERNPYYFNKFPCGSIPFPSSQYVFFFYKQINDHPNCPGLCTDASTDAPSYSQWFRYQGIYYPEETWPWGALEGDFILGIHISGEYGIKEWVGNTKEFDLSFVPSIIKNKMKIKLPFKGRLKVRDISGRIVFEKIIKKEGKINLKGIKSGIYFLDIFGRGKKYSKKIIILKGGD